MRHDSGRVAPRQNGINVVGQGTAVARIGPSTGAEPLVSVVIPVFNEEGNLEELHRRLTRVFADLVVPCELLFVDDGSTDRSFQILERLHSTDERVRVLQFSRNFGHHIAITAGMDAAVGDLIVLMDADLQDLPEEIPTLYNKLQEGYDVAYAIRKTPQHSFFKRITSAVFFHLMCWMIKDFTLNTGIFRIVRRPVLDAVKQCRETSRLVIGLLSWAGFRQVGVEVKHGKRFAGETKYSLAKQVRLALTTLVAFTDVPLRLVTYVGLVVSTSSLFFAACIIGRKVFWGLGEVGWPSLMVVVSFLGGLQLLALGVFGEYLGRVLTETQNRPMYVISQRLEGKDRCEDAAA